MSAFLACLRKQRTSGKKSPLPTETADASTASKDTDCGCFAPRFPDATGLFCT